MNTYKTLTKEGEQRKRNKLIVDFLEKTDPKLFIKLFKKAQQRVDNDNADPLAKINAYGLNGTPHYTSDKIAEARREREQLAKRLKAASNAKKK